MQTTTAINKSITTKLVYGYELVLDIHECDPSTFNRDSIENFFDELCDLIDMEKERNRDKVMHALHESFSNDKARTHILKISELGLVQISRERTREDLIRILCEPCIYCDGRGYTKSPMTMCHELFREIRLIGSSPKDKKIIIGVHPSVASLLYDEARQDVEELEQQYRKKIIIKADSNLHLEQFDIISV